MMGSLRSYLSIRMLAGIALLLALFGFGVYEVIRRALLDEFDTALQASARTLAASVEVDDGEVEVDFDARKLPEFQSEECSAYFQFWLGDGRVLSRSPSLEEIDLPRFCGDIGKPVFRPLRLPHGQKGRAVGFRFIFGHEYPGLDSKNEKDKADPGREEVTLVLAKDIFGLEARLRFLRFLLAGAGLVTMAVAFWVTSFTIRRGLKPLKYLAARIAGIKENGLSERIPAEDMPSEMKPVVHKLNDLLARLDAAFGRERAFTADVAHELRTPLAGALSTLEVALRKNREAKEYQEALEDCLSITRNMQSMVETLLLLARLDAGQIQIRCERIDLSKLVSSCWQPYAGKAQSQGISFHDGLPPDLSCTSSCGILTVVLSNLFANAVEYTNKGGEIFVEGKTTNGSVEIKISNTGCQLKQDDLPRVFHRFWRGDTSRKKTGVHYGLGLPLVQRAIDVLGGTSKVSVESSGLFAVRLFLPIRPAPF